MINLEEAKERIKSGRSFSATESFNFDINVIFEEELEDKCIVHASKVFRYFEIKSLLHLAIQCRNKNAVNSLLAKEASKEIQFLFKEVIWQRWVISGGFGGAQKKYSEWKNRPGTVTRKETIDLVRENKMTDLFSVDDLNKSFAKMTSNDEPESSGSVHDTVAEGSDLDKYTVALDLYDSKYYRRTLQILESIPPDNIHYENAQEKIKEIKALKPQTVLPKLFDNIDKQKSADSIQEFKMPDNQVIMDETEYRLQVQTEKHFFSPSRTYKRTSLEMANRLQFNRCAPSSLYYPWAPLSVNMWFPARQAITAELSVMGAALRLCGRGNINNRDYHTDIFCWETAQYVEYREEYLHQYGYAECIQLFDVKNIPVTRIYYRQKLEPHMNYIGNAQVACLGIMQPKPEESRAFREKYRKEDRKEKYKIHYTISFAGSYDDIYAFLNNLVSGGDKNKVKMLVSYMRRFANKGIVPNIDDLKEIFQSAGPDDVQIFASICYHLFIKEVTGRMFPREECMDLPLATAQARAFLLLENGILTLKEVFSKDAPFGVFTGTNIFSGSNLDETKTKIEDIHRVYMTYCSRMIRKKNPSQFWAQETAIDTMRREEVRTTLANVYGGDSDTDGEGYDAETADALYPSVFNFDR